MTKLKPFFPEQIARPWDIEFLNGLFCQIECNLIKLWQKYQEYWWSSFRDYWCTNFQFVEKSTIFGKILNEFVKEFFFRPMSIFQEFLKFVRQGTSKSIPTNPFKCVSEIAHSIWYGRKQTFFELLTWRKSVLGCEKKYFNFDRFFDPP